MRMNFCIFGGLYMKKIFGFIINSVALFVSYFIMTILVIMVLQTPMRILFDADSKSEYFWKTIVLYAGMVVVCVGQFLTRDPGQKVQYLKHIENTSFDIKDSCLYVLKNKDFWKNSIGFSIWPIMIPKIFGVINLLYVSAEFLQIFPKSILTIFTVDLPFIAISFVTWIVMLYSWSAKRLHKPNGK